MLQKGLPLTAWLLLRLFFLFLLEQAGGKIFAPLFKNTLSHHIRLESASQPHVHSLVIHHLRSNKSHALFPPAVSVSFSAQSSHRQEAVASLKMHTDGLPLITASLLSRCGASMWLKTVLRVQKGQCRFYAPSHRDVEAAYGCPLRGHLMLVFAAANRRLIKAIRAMARKQHA